MVERIGLNAASEVAAVCAVLLALSSAANAAAGDDCTFDQAYLAKATTDLARRHVGATVHADEHTVSWRLKAGDVVTVGHGGCVDLGTRIAIAFVPGSRPATAEAIRRLLGATARYWTRSDANAIAAVLMQRKFMTRVREDGTIEYESIPDPTSRFTFGFTITVSADEAVVFWTEA